MRRIRVAVACAALAGGLLAASPASACIRTLVVPFDQGGERVTDSQAVASFVSVPTYGIRQKIIVRVAAPDHDLAKRRAATLADLLQAHGLMPSGILIETEKRDEERAVVLVFPPPRIAEIPAIAQAAPAPRSSCGG